MGYTHGKNWTDEEIEKGILYVVNQLKLDHFPTHTEMDSVIGNKSLSCVISKRQGSLYWAEKLGLTVKYSETSFGNRHEVIAINDIYENTNLNSIQTSSRHPYDLLVDNCVKIDVKAAKSFTNNSGVKAHSFNLEKREPTCDIFILYCLDDNEIPTKILVIPACSLLGQTQIGIGEKSKWDYYINKWNYITEYRNFFNQYKYKKDKV